MKNLVIIVHANAQQNIADMLRSLKEVEGFTFCNVEGHGIHVAHDPFLSARDKVVGYVPRVRVDILLEDENVKVVLDALRNPDNEVTGQGIYWTIAVIDHGRL